MGKTTDISVLHLGLSYRCNMRCAHCFADKDADRMSERDHMELLDRLCRAGLFMVYYTYGEPLLADCFWNVVAYGREKGLIQVLMSNGLLIDVPMAQRIKTSGIDKVFVSLDHPIPEKHDANRGVPGAFEKAVCAIQNLQANGVAVGVANTVTQKNAGALWDMYRLCADLGVKNISFLRERDKRGLADIGEKGLHAYRDFFAAMVEEKRDGIMFHDPALLPVLEALHSAGRISGERYEKYRGMNMCHQENTVCVEPNGCVSRCNLYKRPVGNYLENRDLCAMAEEAGRIWGCCYEG